MKYGGFDGRHGTDDKMIDSDFIARPPVEQGSISDDNMRAGGGSFFTRGAFASNFPAVCSRFAIIPIAKSVRSSRQK
jgi:hypothetical protein